MSEMAGLEALAATFVDPPRVVCPRCGDEVPTGSFCGACGAHVEPASRVAARLRADAFSAAPSEHLSQPSLVSTLFPHLPHRSHAFFCWALAGLAAVLVVLGSLRLEAPVIAVAALGVPLLFQLYLAEVDLYEEQPWAAMLLVFSVAAGAGVGYSLWTGPVVANALAAAPGAAVLPARWWLAGILVPVGAQALMLLPAVLARLSLRPARESLDGFALGAAGALGFVCTDTLTRLWPALAGGIRPTGQSASGVLTEGLLQGITIPLVAAAGSGLLVAAVWAPRRASPVHQGRLLTSPAVVLAVVIAVQAGLGIADLWRPGDAALLGLHAAAALVLLAALRVGLHLVLLDEAHEVGIGGPRICPHCRHVVAAMPFCSHCGAAARSSSRRTRSALSLAPVSPALSGRPQQGYQAATPAQVAALVGRRRHPPARLLLLAAPLVALVGLAVVTAALVVPSAGEACHGPSCGPLTSPPVGADHVYRSSRYGFAVGYFSDVDLVGPLPVQASSRPGELVLSYGELPGGEASLTFAAEPDTGRSPEAVVDQVVAARFPGATFAYGLWNPMVGYQPGYGAVYDYWPESGNGTAVHERVIVVAAVKRGLAVVAIAEGPYLRFTANDPGIGHPTAIDTLVGLLFDDPLNSVRWPGDPLR